MLKTPRMKTPIPLLLAVAATGCFSTSTVKQKNLNTGTEGQLTFGVPGPTAIGSSARVLVSRQNSGAFECLNEEHFTTSVYMGGETCQFLGKTLTITRLVGADCTGDCTAEIDGAGAVNVFAHADGKATVTVSAELSDGTRVTDTTQVEFATADRIAVTCLLYELCPGPNAVFPGAKFAWAVRQKHAELDLEGPLDTSVAPAGILTLATEGGYLVVRALTPGTATVTFRARGLVRSLAVRVVSTGDVDHGEIHLPVLTADEQGHALDAASDVDGGLAPGQLPAWTPLLPVWRLKDGAIALGLVAEVKTTTPGAKIVLPFTSGSGDPLTFGVGEDTGCKAQKVELRGTVGGATLETALDLTCP